MPSNLPTPLRKLRAYQTRTVADLMRELKRARKEVRAMIALAAAKAKAASSAKEREELYAEIEEKYRELAEGIDAHIKELTEYAAKAGHEAALADMPPSRAKLAAYDPGRAERYFKIIHPSNERSLAAVFTDQMTSKAVSSLRFAVVDVFRRGAVEGLSANEMQKALRDRWDELAADDDAYRFTDRAGRQWEGARYLQMLVRTTAQRAAIESEIDTLAAHGFKLAQINRVGDGECPVCAAWEGRIILMTGKSRQWPTYEEARAAGMFHPNCVHRPLPVDSLIDAAEIERQSKLGKPSAAQMADREFMQRQRDKIDEARYTAEGMSAEDARRAVTADRLERAIRSGTFSDEAAKAARRLTPEQLDAIRERGIPKFEKARNKEQPGTVYKGRILTPRDPSADDILRVLGLSKSGGDTPHPPVPQPAAKPKPKPKPEPKQTPTPTPKQMVGKTGDWKSMGLEKGEAMKADDREPLVSADDARARIAAGESVDNPIGETLAFDAVTLKHLLKPDRKPSEIKKRLAEMDQAKATVEKPHEIWKDRKTGRKTYIRFVKGTGGNVVVNVVDHRGRHIYSWHTNERSLNRWRKGTLVYVR